MKGFTNNFGEYFLSITIIFLICYIFYKIYKWLKPTPFPYVKTLLSKNELSFYKKLKPISEKYGMHILCKIRMADIVEVKKGLRREEWSKYFNKIKSKHVDFALADPDTMEIAVLIELDDKSHIQKNRAERDNFVDRFIQLPIFQLYIPMETI